MFEDIITKPKCRNCPDHDCDCDQEEKITYTYTCIGCDKEITVGQHCPTCGPQDAGVKKTYQQYKVNDIH